MDALLERTSLILDLLAKGVTEQQILNEHPELEREDIRGALLYAQSVISDSEAQIEAAFNTLALQWKREVAAISSIQKMVLNPNYQRIIGMGPRVLPVILRSLKESSSHWFWALTSITGENPIPAEHHGRINEMANDWIEWGRRRGLIQ